MDLGGWLLSLGLEQYEAAFRENAIDETLLPTLTAEDLKDLGIKIVGHRRRLLNAIAVLNAKASATSPDAAAAVSAQHQDTAERRQVTVVFSDLVGSTELSARMDPEDLREVIAGYHECVTKIVQHHGGFVSQYLGDGVLIYFGYPVAHEDDAERAVLAGLELVEAVALLENSSTSLQSRVGIATGLVVVGDITDAEHSRGGGIIGETPNVAERLQSGAEPNQVIIAEGTKRLLGNFFELKYLGAKSLKGIARPVQAWAVLRASSVASRFEALHASGLTALVGREDELEFMLRRWSRAKIGEGQVVLLSGEPGIGKSRLTEALLERIATEPHKGLRYFCSPHYTGSSLYPIAGQMERAARIAYSDSPEMKLDKLDALLKQTSTSNQDASLFAEMLSLPNDGRYAALKLTPDQRREKILDAVLSQVAVLADQNPLLMIFEDAHWSDPTSLEAVGRVVKRIAALSILLIVTYRPEFELPWTRRPHVMALAINRLAEREVGLMIDSVVGDKALPANVRREIIERTDGIPLFVEEMTRAVLEAESHSAVKNAIGAIPSATLEVPASLHASLMARLDRLGPAKEVAQIGAAIGREFPHALLAAVARKPEAQLNAALDRLLVAGLLFRQGEAPDTTYLFKHALVQDAAHSTLLRGARRALHARIAETLESHFADLAERQPELLARHCTEAGLIEKAAPLWGKAGQRSLDRSALLEAMEHLTRALGQIAGLSPTPMLRRERIRLQIALLTPLIHVKGYAAPETMAAAEQARLLIEQAEAIGEGPEDPLLLFSVLYSFWVARFVAFDGNLMRELASQFLALAEKQGATVPLMIGHRNMGVSLLHTGDFDQACTEIDQAITLFNPAEHRQLATRFGQDVGVALLFYRSQALWPLGFPERALSDANRAIKEARQIDQAVSLMAALTLTSLTHIHCGNYAIAHTQLDEVVKLASEKGALFWKVGGILVKGCLLAVTGNASAAVATITSGLNEWRATGTTVWMPTFLSYLARAHVEVGQFDDAWACINEAMTTVQTANERWCEADVYRIAGEIALCLPDKQKAEPYFEHALTVARAQMAKSWELRAAISMAQLWRDHGKCDEASELLAPVYSWFTEGFDTLDLRQAKALLTSCATRTARRFDSKHEIQFKIVSP
jgi:class 3 adenylate cyclase/tetratricopeptide (TPR) repeat protein